MIEIHLNVVFFNYFRFLPDATQIFFRNPNLLPMCKMYEFKNRVINYICVAFIFLFTLA